MHSWWFTHESGLYAGFLVAGFLLVAVWETWRPRRVLLAPTGKRWLLHGLFLLVAGVIGTLLLRTTAVALSLAMSGSAYGVLNRALLPFPVRAILSFLLLDFVRYAQHYACHSVPLLWRVHKVHHADHDFDLSTGVRFHPFEALFTEGTYLLVIVGLTPPPSAVLCYEMYTLVQTFFGHANIRLPVRLERMIRSLQVTPEMHRIHHSMDCAEQRSNFANIFSFWDRLFRTYRDQPEAGDQLEFGLEGVTVAQSVRALAMLALPFVHRPASRVGLAEAFVSGRGTKLI